MRARSRSGIRNIDLVTFSIFLSLVAIGWLMIYTVGHGEGYSGELVNFLDQPIGKQTIWIVICFFVFIVILFIDWKFWQTFSYLIYGASILLLIGVVLFGVTIKGATSWYSFGGFSFQPSEIAKFGTCLALSSYLSAYNTNLKFLNSQIIAFSLFLMPLALIMLQPDLGSAVVFLSFIIVLYREGLSVNYYLIGFFAVGMFLIGLVFPTRYVGLGLLAIGLLILCLNFKEKLRGMGGFLAIAGAAAYTITEGFFLETIAGAALLFLILGAILWRKKKRRLVGFLSMIMVAGGIIAFVANYAFNNVLKPHQQERINAWLRPHLSDPKEGLYNILQSKMAISSGGFEGKGFLKGTMTKLNYVPEQSTDFIFCTIGEEQGFIGSFAIIILFLLLMIRITIIAERQRSNFSRPYAYCVVGVLFFHFMINIGMTMGLMPVIGIPLPFISKGGSSLLGFTLMIAVLLKLDSNRFSI